MEEGGEGAVGGGDREESEKPPELVAVDHSLPTTTVQIRLSDGSRGGMLLIKRNEQHINILFLILNLLYCKIEGAWEWFTGLKASVNILTCSPQVKEKSNRTHTIGDLHHFIS